MAVVALDTNTQTTAGSSQTTRAERDQVMSKAMFWRAILVASDDIDRLARRAVAQLPTSSRAALTALHDDMRGRLARLRTELAGVANQELVMLVLVFHFDERVMRHLPDTARLQWVPLQTEWIGSSHGGTEFFRVLDKLRETPKTPSLNFEVFYYCLHNGFVGRYAGEPDTIAAYKRDLESRIEVPAVSEQPEDPTTTHTPLPRSWHPAAYYAVTFLCIVVLTALITLATNC